MPMLVFKFEHTYGKDRGPFSIHVLTVSILCSFALSCPVAFGIFHPSTFETLTIILTLSLSNIHIA